MTDLDCGPRHRFVHVLEHEIHVTMWGDPAAKPIVMWHGLARTGRDFDELARALSDRYFVICPDTIGRGLSSWSRNPKVEYTLEYYAGIALDLLDAFGIERAGWIGTSMGGLISMRLASGPGADCLSWMILNDIGPELPQPAVDRIRAYAGEMPCFADLTEAMAWFRAAYVPFGENSDAFWDRMLRSSVRRRNDGLWVPHYDPHVISAMFDALDDERDPWARWDRIRVPTHLIYGAESDLMPDDLARRMAQSGPTPGLTSIADTGHAPTLARPQDAKLIATIIDQLEAAG